MQVKQYLHSNDLALAMQQAGWVWCRSGYTTVMDLIRLNTRAVLVPTPGQSEQNYLAQHLSEAGWFPFQLQDQVNIDQAIAQLQRNASPVPTIDFNRYKQVIDAWLIQHFSPDHQ
jgi:predicted glycosyltransferase